ncbi:MAG: 6-carboxyhexanoate--CoA ligase [Desulfuromonadales bacterium]|nr:6-carboxyhexanoate--CoA ligase [Desulfuromonadales bacterium]
MNTSLYSVRMRASRQGQHLGGAERIVTGGAVSEAVAALTLRAMSCANGPADEIHCSAERVDPATVRYEQLPDVATHMVRDWQDGRHAAACLLSRAGVEKQVAMQALQLLANGAGGGGAVMRGAVIMDAKTGERLEADPSRGVRVSRMDLSPECRAELAQELAAAGLGHHRVLEALVLAGKVLRAPGIVAELCWSDDPAYTTGYVAALSGGYQRISALKPLGDARGGRVFFVDRAHVALDKLTNYLERQAVLFNASGTISAPGKWVTADE